MKQHQLIATEPEKRGAYEKIKAETLKVFKGADLFKGIEKRYEPKTEGGDPLPSDSKKLVTTVAKRLAWTENMVAEMLDFEATRDKTNMKSSADLVVDGVTIAKAVPATTLLSLEKRLKEIRDYYDAVPTLDLSQEWAPVEGTNDEHKHGPDEQYRYVKKTSGVVLYQHTDKHPAQVKEVTDDVLVGTWKTTHYSGEAHPGEKAAFLARIDKLIEGAKRARSKANETEIEETKVGKAIFDFIHSRKS
jgi:hypothetical protein